MFLVLQSCFTAWCTLFPGEPLSPPAVRLIFLFFFFFLQLSLLITVNKIKKAKLSLLEKKKKKYSRGLEIHSGNSQSHKQTVCAHTQKDKVSHSLCPSRNINRQSLCH